MDGQETPKTALSEKPGFKTTEFWIALAMGLAGAYLMGKGQDDLGAFLMGASGFSYTAGRAYVKGKTKGEPDAAPK